MLSSFALYLSLIPTPHPLTLQALLWLAPRGFSQLKSLKTSWQHYLDFCLCSQLRGSCCTCLRV